MNPLLQGHSRTTPETSRNAFGTNQGTKEDDSLSEPHPEADIFRSQTTQNSAPEDGYDTVTGVTEEIRNRHDMVTGVYEESLCRHDMVTGVHKEVAYCSASTSSGKQKRNRYTSQPQFRTENTPTTIEADKILLALQQFAINNKSANFHNKISKLPKSLSATVPKFDGKSEKFGLLEDLFETSLKIHDQPTEDDRINYLHSFTRGNALQTF